MCGIVGIVGKNNNNGIVLSQMLQAQAHRGPDANQTYCNGTVFLGHNRLSIIDLTESANQPMISNCKQFVIVFNGEIYNYLELKKQLEIDYNFKTQSDTEVLLAGYIRFGKKILDKINGMFSFSIWDIKSNNLFISRDRFGVKPLYYTVYMDQFYFSSEIKALFAAKIPRNKNNKVWSNYLIYGTYGLPNETFWDTIHQLPAGHYLEIPINSNFVIKNLKPIRWYNFIERINQTNYSKKENLKEEYYNLLIKAIKYRFRSDVPLGMNLSGGLDSSILINLVSKNLPINQKIEAFTFYSNVEKYDELPWVKMLLKDKKYKLNEVLFLASEVPELITEISLHQDEPFGGFPTLAYSLLFKKASNKGIKVILDGQGMDEAWAGYDYYHNQTNAIIQGLNSSPVRPEILTNDFILFSDKENYPTPFNNNLQNLQYRDIFYTKIPRALRFNDRISMQYGTELREPFLDYKLVELAFVQDNNLKTPEDQTKKTLREIVKNNMNDKIVLAPKRPIQTPQREWIANELKDYFDEQINVFSNFDFVNKKQVINLWSSYCKGKKDNSFYIWQWVNLAILNK